MDFKAEIGALLSRITNLSETETESALEVPPEKAMGDFAFPCFRLARTMKKSPDLIAGELAEKLRESELFSSVVCSGAYLNFFLNREIYVKNIFTSVFEEKENFGKSGIGGGKCVVIDYSSPNIAKSMHVGHLRSAVIGHSLYNIYNFIGYKSFSINYLGDWGTQFGKLIVAYKKWGSEEDVLKRGLKALDDVYVRFHKELENDESLADEARSWFVKMQSGDDEALSIWRWFKDISLSDCNRIYEMLDIKFDSYNGESFYNDKMDAVVDELKEKNILTESDGAMVVDLEQYKMPPCLILRRDGGTLYPTRDLASVFYRKKTYDFDKAVYVTDAGQSLHFAQWFKVVELMGYEWAKDLVHVPFGIVMTEEGKIGSRKGGGVTLEEMFLESIERIKTVIEEKNPDLEDKDKVAEQIGIGALVFNDLYNTRIKDYLFSWDKVLNFDGETGPYLQYTHARCNSIIEKVKIEITADVNYSVITDEASFEIAKLIDGFRDKAIEAAQKFEPYIISRYLIAVAQSFNRFYHDNPVINSDDETKKARLLVVFAVKNIIKTGLALLGISAPDKM